MAKDSEVQGLYVPAEDKLYVIKDTVWTDKKTSLDRLRKILLARDIVDFSKPPKTGSGKSVSVASLEPRMMSVYEAKQKGYEVVEVPASEMEVKRIAKAAAEKQDEPKKANGMFKK